MAAADCDRKAPPRAQRKGKSSLDSPVPVRKAPKPIEAAPKPEPRLLRLQWSRNRCRRSWRQSQRLLPTRSSSPASSTNRRRKRARAAGLAPAAAWASGTGTGLGKGDGSGIGDGSGGGMGGGPYRPGSGVLPPRILREVKAGYTEDARRANIEGEVVLEIVVRRDGSVSDVKLLNGLPRGLNERAIAAVRQWRFAPATRLGQAVDVIVEVAVEFKLR